MKNKMAIVVSVFVTVMILTVIGGLVTVMAKGSTASEAVSNQSSSFNATKEAQYQQLIAQANQTIAQANQEIAALQAQNQALANPTAVSYPVSVDQAAVIAAEIAGEPIQQTPSLVNYIGTVAYEVAFANGKVYVDATTGNVLFNGVQVSYMVTSQQAAQIAMNYTGNSKVTGVVSGTYNGNPAFRVSFQNGEQVYVDAYGTILAVQVPPTLSNVSNPEHEDDD